MKTHITPLCLMIIVSAFLTSCAEQEEPREDVAWLAAQIENMEQDTSGSGLGKYMYILTGTYEGSTVYIFGNCCPHCNTVTTVYDSEENLLGFIDFTGVGNGIAPSSIQNVKVYWSPKKSACNLSNLHRTYGN